MEIRQTKSTISAWKKFVNNVARNFLSETKIKFFWKTTKYRSLRCAWIVANKEEFKDATYTSPNTIQEVKDDVTEELLKCATSGRNYKITKAELALLRKLNMPLPTECFFERNNRRNSMRNKRKLYDRKCAKNGEDIITTYQPENPAIVYCEDCYLAETY
ncbi:hypothetical protein COY05_05360 [Candidatus Peregrinibacteria bacterium CG_4_10_14_0_2_um_filter_38_24]|nr:MAG: hypothetical protein COY05_05360 [Candidatus Peregrinibacteria bacterium CG_4_10_14_0_2_um_filter_38_24]PJC38930.1 MAG: hypothetical protein CO044_02410 [Candidatus Peregrinibacteria bacterium CG_4_9_14_0_2_um_filter_38_9]